jgi:hypothetical protein
MNRPKRILLIGILLLGQHFLFAQISPGDLSKAHSYLEGVSNCTKCHAVGNKVTTEKCLACHADIKNNIEAGKGYHASAEVKGKKCSVCHNEHHGLDFNLINLNKKLFNHNLTGFKLLGEHAKKDCNACHKSQFIKDPKLKKKSFTYLGLTQACLLCHDDYHQGKLSPKCETCHNFNSFKDATGFDHNKTKFPLLGQHKTVKCLDCHKTQIINGKKFQNFSGLKFANCTDCHEDVHKNKFGQNCKLCHTEESFHFNKGMKAFDHDKTSFKLIGKHRLVDCKQCHKGSLTAPLKHTYCKDCHADYHKGDFTKNGIETDCNQCHTNNGFTPSTFTIEKHNQLKFHLDGAHLATDCTSCHKKQNKWTFRNMGNRCVDCHKNEHKGFIEDKFFPNEDCTACHNVTNWKKITFDHNLTGYKLEGSHALIACGDCHYDKNEAGISIQKFKGLSHDCSSCHSDSHFGQFEVKGKTDCTRCHGFDKFENSKFDHNTARFKLDGAHVKVSCDKCHKPVMNEKGKYIEYKLKNIECSACHS